jgi:hypothetical protein
MLYRPPRVLLTVFTRSGRAYGGRLFGSKRPKIVAAFCCRLNALNQLFGKGNAEPGFGLKLEQNY